jgi:hypothetical protein
MAPTPGQQELIDAAARVLRDDPGIEAAWLGGSLGRGAGDAFSDVDLVALVRPPAGPAETGLRYGRVVGRIAQPVLVNPLFGGRIVNVVTADWRRFDISFVAPDELGRYDAARLVPLFNRGEHAPPRKDAAPYRTSPETALALANEFLRVLGLLVVADGREEWTLAVGGAEILRRLVLNAMLEDNGVGPDQRGGALRRNPFLTDGQRRALEGLPPVAANRDSVFAANLALAALFLPLARRLVERTGAAWPADFEAATRRHLQARLGLILP